MPRGSRAGGGRVLMKRATCACVLRREHTPVARIIRGLPRALPRTTCSAGDMRMTIRHSLQMLTAAAVCLTLTHAVRAQQPAAAGQQAPTAAARPAALTDTIPLDPKITSGRLPNGRRYYIRENKKPE